MPPPVIRTPDHRLRVFVSSTLGELAEERGAVRKAVEDLRLVPVMFELGARPHPPRELYRAYLAQSHVFLGIYWQRYGWIAPGEDISGLEDEYRLAGDRPRLLYLKGPAPDREPRLAALLADMQEDDRASYKHFTTADELATLVRDDLAVLLTERFEAASSGRDDGHPVTVVPVPVTPTVGREAEVADVLGRLDRGARLVTLTGVGGIGKTRVAQEVAVAADRTGGLAVHVAPLAAVTDPAGVLPTLAEQLGARAAGVQTPLDALADRLAQERTLLVLDNLEQVAAVGPELLELLRRCPRLQVLATSRQALRVEGEETVELAPLGQAQVSDDLAATAAAPAVQLFVDRARAVHPTFALTEDNVADVVAVCRRLDGLPLAIELAASRSRLLSPRQLRDRLTDSLDLLVGGQDRPDRQRTLRATIDWSHALLDPDEQRLFARLGVFHGGCTLEAAEHVCGYDGAPVLDPLAGLLDKSLLVVEDHDPPRFRMLETVRAFAIERLAERDERVTLQDRHLEHFRAFTDHAQPYLCGPQQLEWSARVDPERPNLRAAVGHALAVGDVEAVVDMAWDVYVYYFLRGAPSEPAGWIHAVEEQGRPLTEGRRAIVQAALAIEDVSQGAFDRAWGRLRPALAVFDAGEMPLEQAVAHLYLGLVALGRGDLDEAIRAEQLATQAFLSIDHDWGAASSEAHLGLIHWVAGDPDRAEEHYRRSLAYADRIRNEQLAAQARVGLAATALDVGDLTAALDDLTRAVPLLQRCRDAASASIALEVLAAAAITLDRPRVAAEALATAASTRARLGISLHRAIQTRVEALWQATRRAGVAPGQSDGDAIARLPDVLAGVTTAAGVH